MSIVRDEFINTAIEFEQAGFDFYTEAARKASSELARGVLESLAQDELRHIGFLKTLSVGGATAKSENEALAARLRPIFKEASDAVRSEAEAAPTDVEALNLGLQREDAAVRAYSEGAAAAATDEFRELCEVLVGVEEGHRKLLENVIEYLEHPDGFFLREERWIVEG
jgi:rubrerythrin